MAVLVHDDALKLLAEYIPPSQETPMLVKEADKPIRRVETSLEDLTRSNQQELEQLELVISQGLDGWYSAGKAFDAINQRKLYGVMGYKSFTEYCKKRWGKAKGHVLRYIVAARVKDEICEYIEIQPGNMYLYYSLSKLRDLESKVSMWDKLVATGKQPTVATLRKAIDEHLGVTPKPKTTTTLKVTVESAELLQKLAEQGHMTQAEIVEKLLAKLMKD